MESAEIVTPRARAWVSLPRRLLAGAAAPLAFVTAYAYLWACRRVGPRARTLGRPCIRNAGNIEIGRDALIDSRVAPVELCAARGGRLVIGDEVRIAPGARLVAARYVEIGDRARIGANCVVSDADAPEGTGIWVGDGVTLGENVAVLPGTVIGAGAVVAAGAVVSGSVPPGAVVPGDRGPQAPRNVARPAALEEERC